MARRQGKHGGDEVEKLSGRCRQLATVLREWLDAPGGQLRAKDKLFLRSVADRLDDLAIDITDEYNHGTPSRLRDRAMWAGLAFAGISAIADTSGLAQDALGIGDESAEVIVVNQCLPPQIVTLAAEGFGMANMVINLPENALRPRPPDQQLVWEESTGGIRVGPEGIVVTPEGIETVALDIDDLTTTTTTGPADDDTPDADDVSPAEQP